MAWSGIERFSVQGISFVVMIIMARLLTPADYGLVGMLTIFIAVSQALVDSGFSLAIIRKHDRTDTDNSTAFYFNIAIGLFLYLLLYLCAPAIARYYGQPLLVPLARLLGLSIVFNSLIMVQRALYSVRMDFKTQAKVSLFSALLSGAVGITMAYNGFGVWSIAAQQLVNIASNTFLLWKLSKWRPSWKYSWRSFREMFGFGSRLAVSGVLDCIYNNLYLIVIGKVFNATDLGYYSRANQFAVFPSSFSTGILQKVVFPALCTIQNDDARLKDVYRKILRLSAFINFPFMVMLAAVAKPLILILLNQQWEFSAQLLSILCFSMMWYPIHALNLTLLEVKGRSNLFLKLEVIKKCLGVAILCITIPLGLTAMCVGTIFYSLISLFINTYFTGKLIHVGFMVQMRDLLPTLLYSLSMGGIVWLVIRLFDNNWLQLAVGIVIGLIYFFCATKFTKSRDLKELLLLIKKR